MRLTTKLSRALGLSLVKQSSPPAVAVAPKSVRHFSAARGAFTPNPVALEMIKYAVSLAREQKTEESYARGLLVLEQCESTQPDGNSKGLVELARATLLCERGSHEAAIEGLGKLQNSNLSSIAIKVVASEALVGIYLEHYQEDAASAVADLALQILVSIRLETGDGGGFEVLEARIRALKGLIELICGNLNLAQSIFEGSEGESYIIGSAALCYGEYLHGMRKFSSAKKLYTNVIQSLSGIKDFCDPNNLGACNMTSEEVAIAAKCALGQLETHMGNFSDAEEILTAALKKMEERFGHDHPKIGVILTCIALMYRLKAIAECSSSLLIQEGLFRRALELLKAPLLGVDGGSANENFQRKDIITLARGGYAEALGMQQSRKAEAERLRRWAEGSWGHHWMPLGEALEPLETSPKLLVIDTRICRAV